MYSRIITHDDFDGIVSGALAAHALDVDRFEFAGPRNITDNRFPIDDEDVVCDLPCPSEVGLWFDHHPGNVEDLGYLGRKPEDILGRFAEKPSCARVVFEHFTEQNWPERFTAMVDEADKIDSFDWKSVEDWRAETPGKIVDAAIKYKGDERRDRFRFLGRLIRALRDGDLAAVAQSDWVQERYEAQVAEEAQMLRWIEGDAAFLEHDTDKELVILDRTRHNQQPPIGKNLAYLLYPEALAVIEIKSLFRRGVKTNNISFSMSLSLNMKGDHGKDVGEIMRLLNIGDGHKGAGAGMVDCDSKPAMEKEKTAILADIYKYWKEM